MSVFRAPDLSDRPRSLIVERDVALSADALYRAWTEEFDRWFAAPGSVLMWPQVDRPFFFVTEFDGSAHAHYGRFLRLEPGRLVELTWVTGDGGTDGAETVVTVELGPTAAGTHVRLTHTGFTTDAACAGHREAWPMVLEQMERTLTEAAAE